MTTITSIHQRELHSVLSNFSGFAALQANEYERERLYHTWIPLLSTYVTHDSIEAAIDEWHSMIKQPTIWINYIEETKANATRPLVIQTLERWKNPFIFAASQTEPGIYVNWSDQKKWQVAGTESGHFIGLALPLLESQNAMLVHFFEADAEFFEDLESGFNESGSLSRQHYLQVSYLTCLSFLGNNT